MAELLLKVYDSERGLVGITLQNPETEIPLSNPLPKIAKIRGFRDMILDSESFARAINSSQFIQIGPSLYVESPKEDDILEVSIGKRLDNKGYRYVFYNTFEMGNDITPKTPRLILD